MPVVDNWGLVVAGVGEVGGIVDKLLPVAGAGLVSTVAGVSLVGAGLPVVEEIGDN